MLRLLPYERHSRIAPRPEGLRSRIVFGSLGYCSQNRSSTALEQMLLRERFDRLEEFYAEVGRVFVNDEPWGENLDALNILLHGGIKQIPKEFRLVWKHAKRSREQLGYAETVRQLTLQLRDCHLTVLIKTAWALRAASKGARSDSIRLDNSDC